jgi:outer membrane protein assembly factor BamB
MKWIRAVLPVGLMLSAQVFSNDWPHYRGPAGDGKSPEKMISVLPEVPQPRWKIPTPLGFSSFSVGGQRAYVIVRREVEGVPRDVLIAVDARDGKERWFVPLSPAKYDGSGDDGTPQNSGGDGPRSSPAVDGNRVYILTADLLLACFDATNGKEVWKRDLVKENGAHNISWKNAASPVIEGDLIFVAGGGEKQALLGINKNNGTVVWKAENDRITHATPIVANVGGVRQVIFYTQKGLVAVQPTDGKVLWRHSVRYNVSTAASPVVFRGHCLLLGWLQRWRNRRAHRQEGRHIFSNRTLETFR